MYMHNSELHEGRDALDGAAFDDLIEQRNRLHARAARQRVWIRRMDVFMALLVGAMLVYVAVR